MLKKTETLSQAELDDQFHHGIFLADTAAEDAIRNYFEEDDDEESMAFCQEIIEVVQEAIDKAEKNFLGPDRQAAVTERGMRRIHGIQTDAVRQ